MFVKQGTLLDGNLLYEWTLTHTTCHVCYSRSQAICSIQDAEANYSGQEVCGRLKDKERTHTYMTCLLRGLSLRIIEELSTNVLLRKRSHVSRHMSRNIYSLYFTQNYPLIVFNKY